MLCDRAAYTAHLLSNGWVIVDDQEAYLKTGTEIISLSILPDGSLSYEARTPLNKVYCKGFAMIGYTLDFKEVSVINLMGFYPYKKDE